MAAPALIETYQKLRKETVWSILAADSAPETIALLQLLLFDRDRRLKESVLIHRLTAMLNECRTDSVTEKMAAAILAQWRQKQYVIRSLMGNDTEPSYELSAGAFEAISFISSQTQVRTAPTGSRLELLIHSVKKLVDDTDTDSKRRIERLRKERKIIDQRIQAIKNGQAIALSPAEIRAQIQDIVSMIESMDADFLRVRDRFAELADKIQADILQGGDTRKSVLNRIFQGYDSIRESDEGKTFENFHRFLYQEITSQELAGYLEVLEGRNFWTETDQRNQMLISEILISLTERTRETQQVMVRLAAGLRRFVQSREYLQNQRMKELLEKCRKLSLELVQKGAVRPGEVFLTKDQPYVSLVHPMGDFYNPDLEAKPDPVAKAQSAVLDLEQFAERLAAAEINYTWLKKTIALCLKDLEVVTIAKVLERFPAAQGLATIIGYIHLGVDYAERLPGQYEFCTWSNRLDEEMRGKLPVYCFTRSVLNANGEFE